MDEADSDDFYGSESLDFPYSTNYYPYAFAATVIIGLPLFFVALYKIYMDHQHHQDKKDADMEKMKMLYKMNQGHTAHLRHDLNTTRTHCEMAKMKMQQNERQMHLDHKKQIRELESKISRHSQDMQKAENTIAILTSSCHELEEDLQGEKENAEQANESCRKLNEEKNELLAQIQELECNLDWSRNKIESQGIELSSTKEKLKALELKSPPQQVGSSDSHAAKLWRFLPFTNKNKTCSVPEDDSSKTKSPRVPEDDSTNTKTLSVPEDDSQNWT